MKINIVILTGLLWCIVTRAEITPVLKIPEDFDETRYSIKTIEDGSHINYIQQMSKCNDIKYKDFFFLKLNIDVVGRNTPETVPISEWLCLYDVDIYAEGFGPGLKERAFFSKKSNHWIKGKSKKSDISPVYNNIPYIPIELYNITSINAKGFAIISENIIPDDSYMSGGEKVKKIIYFCMIHDISALCGSGSMIRNINGKEIDFTPYVLKSLESMEMGIKAPRVNNEK